MDESPRILPLSSDTSDTTETSSPPFPPTTSPLRPRRWNKPWTIAGFTVVFIAVIGLTLFAARKNQDIRSRATGGDVTLELVPASPTVNREVEFTEVITANTQNQTISAAELHLSYDPTKLQAIKIEAGTFLPVTLTPGAVGNGAISITLGSQPAQPKKGSGVLATVTFKRLTNAATDIRFDNATQIAAIGRNDNAVGKKTGAHLAASDGAATPTPTPTPEAEPTPTPTPEDELGFDPTPTTSTFEGFGSLISTPTPPPVEEEPLPPVVEETPESFPDISEKVPAPTQIGFFTLIRNFFIALFSRLFGGLFGGQSR